MQPAHALAEFQNKYPKVFKNWLTNYKNLAILSVKDETELKALLLKAEERGIKNVYFKEPDIGNEMTAIALEPSQMTYKITSNYPLALKEFA